MKIISGVLKSSTSLTELNLSGMNDNKKVDVKKKINMNISGISAQHLFGWGVQ